MTSQWNRIFYPLRYGYGLMRFKVPRALSPFRAQPELIGHSGSTGSFCFLAADRGISIAGTINQMDDQSRPFKLMTKIIGRVR